MPNAQCPMPNAQCPTINFIFMQTIIITAADANYFTLYDSIIPNGFIQVDDYGHWEGCKQALHDFEKSKGESFSLNTIDETGVWFQKSLGG